MGDFNSEPKEHIVTFSSSMTTGFSDFHKMVVTVLKTEFVKLDPLKITYRDYKKYNSFEFNKDLKTKLRSERFSNSVGAIVIPLDRFV